MPELPQKQKKQDFGMFSDMADNDFGMFNDLPNNPETDGYGETVAKGVLRGGTGLVKGLAGSGTRWLGEAMGGEAQYIAPDTDTSGLSIADRIASTGKTISDVADMELQEGWMAPDQQTFGGTFMENPSLKRAVGIISEAVPSLAAAVTTGGLTGSSLAGAALLGASEGAGQYEESRETGKSVAESSLYGGVSTIGNTLLEKLPIDNMLKFGKGALKGAAKGALEEGTQEATQTVFQNLIAKVGYEPTRNLAEGVVESIIGGAGSGGVVGGVTGSFAKAVQDAKDAGATDEDIHQAVTSISDQISDLASRDPQAFAQALSSQSAHEASPTGNVLRQMREQATGLEDSAKTDLASALTLDNLKKRIGVLEDNETNTKRDVAVERTKQTILQARSVEEAQPALTALQTLAKTDLSAATALEEAAAHVQKLPPKVDILAKVDEEWRALRGETNAQTQTASQPLKMAEHDPERSARVAKVEEKKRALNEQYRKLSDAANDKIDEGDREGALPYFDELDKVKAQLLQIEAELDAAWGVPSGESDNDALSQREAELLERREKLLGSSKVSAKAAENLKRVEAELAALRGQTQQTAATPVQNPLESYQPQDRPLRNPQRLLPSPAIQVTENGTAITSEQFNGMVNQGLEAKGDTLGMLDREIPAIQQQVQQVEAKLANIEKTPVKSRSRKMQQNYAKLEQQRAKLLEDLQRRNAERQKIWPTVEEYAATNKESLPVDRTDNELKHALLNVWGGDNIRRNASPEVLKRAQSELSAAIGSGMSAEEKHQLAYNWTARAQKYTKSSGVFGDGESALGKKLIDLAAKRSAKKAEVGVTVLPQDVGFAVVLDGYIVDRASTEGEAIEAAEYLDQDFWRDEIANDPDSFVRYAQQEQAPKQPQKMTRGEEPPSVSESSNAQANMAEMVKEAQRWKGAAENADLALPDKKARLRHSKMTTKGDLDAYLMRKFGIDEVTAREVSNALTRDNLPSDRSAKAEDFAGEPWADAVSGQEADPFAEPTAEEMERTAAEADALDIERNAKAAEKLVIDGHRKNATVSANSAAHSWMRDNGYSAKETVAALRKHAQGKKLTDKQQQIVEAWREGIQRRLNAAGITGNAFEEDAYNPEWDELRRKISDAYELAKAVDEDRAMAIMEKGEDQEILRKLLALVEEGNGQSSTGRIEAEVEGQADGIRPETETIPAQKVGDDGKLFATPPTFGYKEKPDGANVSTLAMEDEMAIAADDAKQDDMFPPAQERGGEKGAYTVEAHKEVMKRLYDGEISVAELQAAYAQFMGNREAILRELEKKTVKELTGMLGYMGQARARGERKAAVVKMALKEMMSDFVAGQSYSYGMEGPEAAIRNKVDSMTEADLQSFAAKVKEARAEREKKLGVWKKALENPETLEEFKKFVQVRGEKQLTAEQLARYDELRSLNNKEQKQAELEKKATVKGVDLDTDMEVVETTHTKKGYPLWVVKLADRVERDVYKDLLQKAKQLGGWYSSYRGNGAIPGFQFKEQAAAEKFAALKDGDVSKADMVHERKEGTKQNATHKLSEMADTLEEKASASLNQDRKTHTHRYAKQAESAEAQARADIALAQTMRNLAAAIESGEATHLDGIRAKTHIETLDSLLRQAHYASERKKGGYSEDRWNAPPTADDIGFAEFPSLTLHGNVAGSIASTLEGIRGGKRLGGSLRSQARAAGPDNIININVDVAKGIVSKLDAAGEKHIGWQLRDSLKEIARLERMGIPDLPSLRAALREYLEYRGKKPAADRMKQLEREIALKPIAGFFPTPKTIVEDMIDRAGIEEGMSVLEPSAGKGNIADAIREIGVTPEVVEFNSDLASLLEQKGYEVAGRDFMEHEGEYDRILMNPPFENGQDIDHVRHAYELLKPGGKLVAIMSRGPFFRSDRKATGFREWLEEVDGVYEDLPEGSFKSSERPTGVATSLVEIEKPEALYRRKSALSDETGPLDFYHGTGADIDAFSIPSWFTTKPELASIYSNTGQGSRKVYPVQLGIQNPVELSFDVIKDLSKGQIRAYQRAGYDGAVAKMDGEIVAVPFAPEQVRSVFNEEPFGTVANFQRKTDTPAFRKWFGNSKVVDENGEPLVVYHGTGLDFDEFDPDVEQRTHDFLEGTSAVFFTTDEESADFYAIEGSVDYGAIGDAPVVYPVFLSIEHPLEINKDGREGRRNDNPENIIDWKLDDVLAEAEINGYDGVIVYGNDGHKNFIVFDPTQIKSATGNNGDFNPTDPRINYQRNQGTGLPVADLSAGLSDSLSQLPGALGKVNLHQSESELPADLQAAIEREKMNGAFDGVYWKGNVHLVADNLESLEMAQKALLHETRHLGLEHLLGGNKKPVMAQAAIVFNKDVAQYLKRHKLENTPQNRIMAAEEVLVDMVKQGKTHKFIDSVIAKVREFIRKVFPDLNLSKAELRNLIANVDSYLQNGDGSRFTGELTAATGPAYMVAAWHGSPHDHDRFDSSKIGTGEGAQAYGFGHYFAGKREIAEWYKDKLSGAREAQLRIMKAEIPNATPGVLARIVATMVESQKSPAEAVTLTGQRDSYKEYVAANRTMLVAAAEKAKQEASGRLYQVELAPNEDELLDWDKPLSEQSAKVREALASNSKQELPQYLKDQYLVDTVGEFVDGAILAEQLDGNELTGEQIYRTLSSAFSGQKEGSSILHSLGIRGIKYLDGSSRGQGEGSHNFVIFDDADINIKAKYQRKEMDENSTIGRLFDTPEQHSVTSAINGAFNALKSTDLKQAADKARTKLVDRMHPIEQLGEKAYQLHRLLGNTHAVLSTFLQHGKLAWDQATLTVREKNQGFLPWLKSLDADGRNFFYWVAAKRAEALEKEGRENWLTADVRKEMLDELFAGMTPAQRASKEQQFAEYNKKFQEFNDNIIQIAKQAGLVSQEQIDSWMRDFYLPFYRIMEEQDDFIAAPHKSKKHISAQIKRLQGGEEKLGDPIENVLRNWAHLIQESQRNVARSAAAEVAVNNGLAQVVPGNESFKSPGARRENSIISYQDNGKAVYLKVNDLDLFEALSEVNAKAFDSMMLKVLGSAKRILTLGATAGPAFRIANLLRDTIHTAVVSKSFAPFVDTAKGLVQVWKESEDYIALMASGGGFGQGWIESGDPKAMARSIEKIIKREGQGAKGNILDSPRKLWAFWEKIGHASEMAARVQLYSNLKMKGETNLKAAYEARDILDFYRTGASNAVRVLSMTTPFLNARIQGLDRMYRGAKEDPRAFLTKGLMVSAASLALWALFHDDDRYKDMEDWEKWQYHHFWLGDQHFRIPKAFEVGALFSTLAESAAATMTGDEEYDFFWRFVGHSLTETFAMNPTPAAFAPAIEVYANKSFFTGRPLEGMALERLPAGERSNPWTPELLKDLGKGLNLSPIKLEHLVQGHFAVLGTTLLGIADSMYRFAKGSPAQPAPKLNDLPGLGRFVRSEAGRSKYATRYYDMAREVNELAATVSHYKQLGDFTKAKEVARAKPLQYKRFVNLTSQRVAALRKQEKQIYASRSLSASQKRARLDAINKRKKAIYQQAYERIKR